MGASASLCTSPQNTQSRRSRSSRGTWAWTWHRHDRTALASLSFRPIRGQTPIVLVTVWVDFLFASGVLFLMAHPECTALEQGKIFVQRSPRVWREPVRRQVITNCNRTTASGPPSPALLLICAGRIGFDLAFNSRVERGSPSRCLVCTCS